MKKLTISFLLGSGLFFSTIHFGARIKGSDLEADSNKSFIYLSLKHVVMSNDNLIANVKNKIMGGNPNVDVPSVLKNQSIFLPDNINAGTNSSIGLNASNGTVAISIPLKCVTYDKLNNFEQFIFNNLQFEENKPITIIGLYSGDTNKFNGIDYGTQPLNGSMTVGSKTKYLTWKNTDQAFQVPFENRFDLDIFLLAKAIVSKNSPSPKVIHKCWGF